MDLLLIAFVVLAAVGGTHLSWSLTDALVRKLRVEPRDWVVERWRGLSEN